MMIVSWVLLLPLCWGIPLQFHTQPSTGAVSLSQGGNVGVRDIAPSPGGLGSGSQQVLHVIPESPRDRESDISVPTRSPSPPPPTTPTPEKQSQSPPKPSHGAFLTTITTLISSTKPENKLETIDPLAAHYVRTLRKAQFPTTLIDRYAHELVALGLLLLVPVTLAVVELAERIGHYYCEEEFPDRGREPTRCFGRERRLRREMRDVREKRVEERRWWRRRSV